MKTFSYLFISALLLTGSSCSSQTTTTKIQDDISGTWKGTSLCQVKNSPCRDEMVVYYFKRATAANTYVLQAYKIIKGVEEEMGALDFVYDSSKQLLTCTMKDRQQRVGVWEFAVKGKHISGTLIVDGSTLFRKVEVDKQ